MLHGDLALARRHADQGLLERAGRAGAIAR